MRHRLIVPAVLFATLTTVVGIPAPPAQAQVQIGIGLPVPVPYFYSSTPCRGCWHGTWRGREGYHRGGGEPWRGNHYESDHYRHDGQYHGGHNQHEGHQ
jgi:hypothetical protein